MNLKSIARTLATGLTDLTDTEIRAMVHEHVTDPGALAYFVTATKNVTRERLIATAALTLARRVFNLEEGPTTHAPTVRAYRAVPPRMPAPVPIEYQADDERPTQRNLEPSPGAYSLTSRKDGAK